MYIDTSSYDKPLAKTIGRELVLEGPVVRLKVPSTAQPGTFVGDGFEISYVSFSFGVKGGNVWCHAHQKDDTEVRGRYVNAQAIIRKRIMSDGRKFLYVDLVPIDNTVATHRMAIVPKVALLEKTEGMQVTETLSPLQGAIVFAPLDAKINQKEGGLVVSEVERARTVSDPQLDRLLRDGWEIKEDHGAKIILSKIKKGKPCEMPHYRPKK
jgi:hypothetical protein